MDYIVRNKSTDSKESRRSGAVQGKGTTNHKQIIEKERQIGANKGRRRTSSSTSETLDEKVTFEKVHNSQTTSTNASAKNSKPDRSKQSAT